jgi:hypothetical protein
MYCLCIDKFRGILTECQYPEIEYCSECEIYQEICGTPDKE